MLPEILLYATAEAAPGARRMGLVGDAIALWSRATRCRAAWAPHEAWCHAAVERAIADLDHPHTALVLGSGLLRDVPLDALLRRFQRVILVDAVHLWPARRRARDPRVTRVLADLTGMAAGLGRSAFARQDPLAAFRGDTTIDFVLSANVLSQLPMALERWYERRRLSVPAGLATAVATAHLDDLASLPGRVCLLTDVRHREVDRDGRVLDETDLLHGATLPEPDEAWDWQVAPRGEIDRHSAHIHRAGAYLDFKRGWEAGPPFVKVPG
jgi:hypothetical protein